MMRRGIAIALLVLAVAACEQGLESQEPIGEPRIDCIGVPPQQCQDALNQARDAASAPLVELVVRCSVPVCTFQQGETQVQARYADGSVGTWGSGWSGPMPAAPVQPGFGEPVGPLPVQPSCLGVAQQVCLDMASSAISELPPGSPAVTSITVRCKAVCTPTKAEGDTIVLFANGTSSNTGWAYESLGG